MAKDVYKKLAERLDNLPGGFPSTRSGVELRILRHLFTPEEAGFALHVNMVPEEVLVIARRAKISQEEAARRLEDMAKKGLIYRIEYDKKPMKYMAAQYVIGIWEFHVNDLSPELIKDMNEYIPALFNLDTWKKAPQLRTIPVGESISAGLEALPYEKAEELVRAQEKFLVAPCICRREHKMMDKGCKKPEESCLIMGSAADYYKRNGLGRTIDLKEALEILKRADRAGLVFQSSNARKISNICCCCGCCCQVLKAVKRHPKPSSIISSPFLAHAETETCEGCGICVERCQMEALSLEDEKVVLNLDRCIGCGLCVTTCSTGSLTLERKPDSEQSYVPRNMLEALYRLARVRKKINPLKQIKMKIESSGRKLRASR
ncbi:MAG: 4Fe-4S dicluster domain-containing protein [Candidatus Aminicenantes bacterium]|nr:4Fe-4S dicluster domain-containing protein [Candidatus Aminicenantes bacterium]